MSKKDTKDPHAVIVIRKLLQLIDFGMIEELQEAEESHNVTKNLEIAETFDAKKGKSFFSRSTDKINKILHKTGAPAIFNHRLTEASLERILVLIDYLKKYIAAEGIFRISGNKKRQEELKHLLDKDLEINFEHDYFTEHDVASVLKQFLAELPEPIITAGHIKVHMQIIDIDNEEKQINALQLLFLLIPPANRHLLQLLLELLHEIADKKESKMTASNLAVVFAPSVMLYKHRSSSCLSAVPENIITFTHALAFMIDHENEVFAIPDDLLDEIEEHKSSRNAQDDETLVVSKPFCAQVDSGGYRTTGDKCTADALVNLYAQMAHMEDTPMKRRFLKRFAEICPGTPPFQPKTRKTEEEQPVKPKTTKTTEQGQKKTFTAPRILSPHRFRSWSRLPLQNTNTAARSETESLCSSPTGRFRSFRTPTGGCPAQSNTEESHENIPQEPATPSGHFNLKFSTPGSIRNPFKRKRRTKSIGSSNAESSSFTRSFFSPKPRRSSSSSQLEKNSPRVLSPTPAAPSTATSTKSKNPSTVTAPVIKKSLVGRDIRSLYTTPSNSKKRNNVCPSGK